MKLYFIRHGESEANTLHIISNRKSRFGLTELGRKQANILVDKLKDIPITAIFSSPILRAKETADIVSRAFYLPYQVTEALREYNCGYLEGRSDEESWEQHRKYFEDWTLHHNYSSKPTAGESFIDIQDRFLPFIESLKHRNDEHILLIGHGGLFQLMLPLVLTNIDSDFVRSHGIGHTECVTAKLRFDGFFCEQWETLNFDGRHIGDCEQMTDNQLRYPTILFDWGDTVMRDDPAMTVPMVEREKVEVINGIADVLDYLHASGRRIVLATSADVSDESQIRGALARGGLDRYFSYIYCFKNTHLQKGEAFYRHILNNLTIPTSDTLMVGDHFEKDVQIPNALGVFAVWFNPRSEEIRESDLHVTVHSMEELRSFFMSLDS